MVTYGASAYHLEPTTLATLKRLQPWRPFAAAALAWLAIIVLVRTCVFMFSHVSTWASLLLYLPAIFLIAGRAGVFVQLTHEATHGLVGPKRLNDWFGNWMGAYPIGLELKGYAEPHLLHHAHANTLGDPIGDREKYRVCVPSRELFLLFLKDISGYTALRGRYLYANAEANVDRASRAGSDPPGDLPRGLSRGALVTLAKIALMQLLILALVFRLNPLHYVLLWLVPLTTAHMVLMRFRGIAEHGLPNQIGMTWADFEGGPHRGTLYTRSFGTPKRRYRFRPLVWIERALIGSLRVYFHREHHAFPRVPYYNLPRLHRLIADQMARENPLTYIPGYFAAMSEGMRLTREA